jgi:hypothetical protein
MNTALADRALALTIVSLRPLPRAQICCLYRSLNQGELFVDVFCLQCMIHVEHVVMVSRGRRVRSLIAHDLKRASIASCADLLPILFHALGLMLSCS